MTTSSIFDHYSLLELIHRWAAETEEDSGRLAKLLAQAILSQELSYELSFDESVFIVRDKTGAILPNANAYLPEVRHSMIVAGAQETQLRELPEETVRAWIHDQLEWVVSH